ALVVGDRSMTSVALFELILGLLGAALLLSLAAGRLGFPPAAALVVGDRSMTSVALFELILGLLGAALLLSLAAG
ncbi:hypothetical protein CTI14_70540, partial [Methylobacterium radiotolerans]